MDRERKIHYVTFSWILFIKKKKKSTDSYYNIFHNGEKLINY